MILSYKTEGEEVVADDSNSKIHRNYPNTITESICGDDKGCHAELRGLIKTPTQSKIIKDNEKDNDDAGDKAVEKDEDNKDNNNNNNNNENNNNNDNNNDNNVVVQNAIKPSLDPSLPKTLEYTMPTFTSSDLKTGKYHTDVIESEKESIKEQSQRMAEYVKNSMKYFWNGYEKCAFGFDEVKPISCTGRNNWGGIGMTIIDSLDTLYIMDLKDEFEKGKNWIKEKLNYNTVDTFQTFFEISIRVLGGLLSSYSLTKEEIFKEKAVILADRFMMIINQTNGFALSKIKLSTSEGKGTKTNLAEIGSYQLEFRYLSKITGNTSYEETSMKIYSAIQQYVNHGLYPVRVNINGRLSGVYSFATAGDSFYEYLLKCWIQGGQKEDDLRDMYLKAKDGLMDILSQRTEEEKGDGFLYIGVGTKSLKVRSLMEHLACFASGLIALDAYKSDDKTNFDRDIEWSKSLLYTCYEMYMSQKTHLSPESVKFLHGEMKLKQKYYALRPETVESMYILYKVTGDAIFRKWGWDIYLAIEESTKVENGYSSIHDVNISGSYEDKTESFFGAETLKYLYLLFKDDAKVDLNTFVFNTEAHPIEILQ